MQGKCSVSRVCPVLNRRSKFLFRFICFCLPLCTDLLLAVHTWYHNEGLSLRWTLSATLSGDSTLFGADSVGAKFPAGYQLTPAEYAGTSVLQTHKMGNWAHKCLFALQFGICIHSDGFFSCANVRDATAEWMSSRRRGAF